MFQAGCLAALALLVILIAIPAVASHYLPAWATLLVALVEAVVLVLAAPRLAGWLFKRFLFGIFISKSRVLRGATVTVHRVEPTTKPVRRRAPQPQSAGEGEAQSHSTPPPSADDEDEDDDEDDDEEESDEEESDERHYVLVDYTLTPRPTTGRMRFYDTSEMMLVPFDSRIKLEEDPTSDDRSASVHEQHLINDADGSETDEFDKLTGPAHLRMIFACPPTLHGRVKFRYYFEAFGDFTIP